MLIVSKKNIDSSHSFISLLLHLLFYTLLLFLLHTKTLYKTSQLLTLWVQLLSNHYKLQSSPPLSYAKGCILNHSNTPYKTPHFNTKHTENIYIVKHYRDI